jgi:hypothetical protein
MATPTNSAQVWRDGVTVVARPGGRLAYELTAYWHGVQVGDVRDCSSELGLPFAKESAHLAAWNELSNALHYAPTGIVANGKTYEARP